MISGINLNEVIEFVLPEDKENPTIWRIGMIPSDLVMSFTSANKDNPTVISYKIIQLGLKGWSNFGDITYVTEKVKLIGYDVELVPIELIRRIPFNILDILGKKIIEMNHLTKPEQKNS